MNVGNFKIPWCCLHHMAFELPVGGCEVTYFHILVAISTIILAWLVSSGRKSTIPLVKGGVPFIGQVFTLLKGSPWDTFTEWMLEYGNIYRFQLFGRDSVFVSDPEMLKIILSTKMSKFKKDTEWVYAPFMVILGNGLVTADGESWRRQRTLLSSHLRIEILSEIPKMALEAVQRLSIKLDKVKKEGSTIEMAEEFRHLTLQVIAEAILSLPPEESDRTFAHMYLPIVEEGNLRTWSPQRMVLPTPSWFKHRKDVEKLNNYVTSLIEKRWALRQTEEATGIRNRPLDVLDKTLGAIDPAEWNTATLHQIRDEIKTFILAGHETSASMLAWSLFELSKEEGKDSLARVVQESKGVYGPSVEDVISERVALPGREALDQLNYTECCLRESLRKYSVVPTVVRVASEDILLDQHLIRRGTSVMLGIQGVHHNPDYWPEPHEYRPERFLVDIKPYTFIPFVEGPRMCLGQYLSLLESKTVLSLLLSRYKFELVDPEGAGKKHPFMVPIIPKTGHYMKVH